MGATDQPTGWAVAVKRESKYAGEVRRNVATFFTSRELKKKKKKKVVSTWQREYFNYH